MKTITTVFRSLLCLLLCSLFWAAAGHAQSERSLIRDGNRSYKDSKFSDAEVNYRKALEKNKDLVPGTFDLGDALYKQGRFGEAAEAYGAVASKVSDPGLKAQALHNLGNALLKEKKLPESIGAYQGALRLSPKDIDTKYNLAYAKALLQRQQQQQQKQNKDQKKDDKKKDDQQKQDQQKQDQQKQQQQQDQQKPDQQKQNEQQQKDQQQNPQQKKQQISQADAERILEALKNEEKNVQKKLHHKVPARVKVEKDW